MTTKIDKLFSDFENSVQKASIELQKEVASLQAAASLVSGGKIMPVESCKLTGACAYQNVEIAKSTSHYFRPTWEQHVKAAQAEVATERARIEELHTKNLPAIENNKKLREQLTALMESVGIASSFSVYETSSSRSTKKQWVTHTAGYLKDLDRLCVVNDGYDHALKSLDSYAKKICEYEAKKAQEVRAESAKKAMADQHSSALKRLAKLAVKYDVDVDVRQVKDAILASDKYLAFGAALLANREDWNDGPELAQSGLHAFSVETPQDIKIHEEINSLIENWDGDGRVFRDCHYNYDFLFSLADTGAVADFGEINEIKEILTD